jgi:hypothetical protein
MVNGISLSLLIGPAVPVPVPGAVIDALTSVEVQTSARQASGFQLTFTLARNSPLETIFVLAAAGGLTPPLRVILVATLNGLPEVLVDGVVTQQEMKPAGGGQPGILTVTGTDLMAMMDLIAFDGIPYAAMPAEVRILTILAKYAVLGIVPLVIPRILADVDDPTDKIRQHKGTDLSYVKHLAGEVGYVFYIQPGPVPGANLAYWGPEIKIGVPQPALTVDMDAETNVENLSFTLQNDRGVTPIVWIHNQLTKIPIPVPIPNVSVLNPPLGLVQPLSPHFEFLHDTAARSIPQAIMMGVKTASEGADCIEGSGRLNVLRYGRLLKARQLVGVRGAGTAFDGLYYVTRVSHSIKRGEYTQSFSLSRNALVSNLPRVPV